MQQFKLPSAGCLLPTDLNVPGSVAYIVIRFRLCYNLNIIALGERQFEGLQSFFCSRRISFALMSILGWIGVFSQADSTPGFLRKSPRGELSFS